MTLSAGYLLAIGAFCHTGSFFSMSPPRSAFPTSNFSLCFQIWIVGGLFLSSQRYDSLFSHLLEINNRGKPPWILNYIHHSPVSLVFSPFPDSHRQKSVSIMGDKEFSRSPLRKSVQDLLLGIDDVLIALPPEIVFCAVPINQMPWIWGLVDACLGRILSLRMVQFQFTNEESMNLALHCGPWSFNDIEEGRKIIPFRIRISGIPSLYLTNAMVRLVRSRIGPVTKVDFEENVNITAFVRVQMDWHCDNRLRFRRNFQFSVGENTIISFHYERLRTPCPKCGFRNVCLMDLWLFLSTFCWIAMLRRLHVDLVMYYWQQYLLAFAQIGWLESVLVSSLLVVAFLQSLPQCYAPVTEIHLQLGCDYIDCVMGLWLHRFGFCGVEMSRLHLGLVTHLQQDLRHALALYGWQSLATSEPETWDGLVMLHEYVEEIYKDEVFQNDLGTEVLVPLYLHLRIRFGHIGFYATFCEQRFSHELLHTNRNKEKSNMKLDNNGSSGRLASKATLRKASSNSLLLYFLLVYGTYICVCNNCVSLILYVFVTTLLD